MYTLDMVDTVIFDFDGVIADSGAVFTEALEEVLNRPEPFSGAEIKQLRNSSPQEIIKLLGIKKWQLPLVVAKGRRAVAARMYKVKVFDDMPEVIKDLHSAGYKIFVLSTNNKEAINSILGQHGLNDYVVRVYSATRVFGKAKRLNSLLRKEHLNKDQCVYIGDEVRDVEASKQVGVKCIAVEWGYSAPSALKSYKPDAMATSPVDLITKVQAMARSKSPD